MVPEEHLPTATPKRGAAQQPPVSRQHGYAYALTVNSASCSYRRVDKQQCLTVSMGSNPLNRFSVCAANTVTGAVPEAILLTNTNTDTHWRHEAAGTRALICFTEGRVSLYSPVGGTASSTNGHPFMDFGLRQKTFVRVFKDVALCLAPAAAEVAE